MKIEPIKRYIEPRFPTHHILEKHPELLAALPERWRVNPVIVGALTGLCLLSTGQQAVAAKSKAASKVAPIFQHGEGRAAFGGVGSQTPTVFLSEDEAREVITEEAAKYGIKFADNGHILKNIRVPVTDSYAFLYRDEGKTPPTDSQTRKLPLKLDGMDDKRNIGFEYVSQADFKEWETKRPERICTVLEIDTLHPAERLQKSLASAKSNGYYAVFYDPVVTASEKDRHSMENVSPEDLQKEWEKEWKRLEGEAAKTAREQLRAQVRDFIKWLKAEGVI